MSRFGVQEVTIPLSGTLSGDIDLSNAREIVGIKFPVVNSGNVFVQGAFNTTSATFTRVQNTNVGSGDLNLIVEGGSKSVQVSDLRAWPFIRIETSIAQSAVRSLAVITRL